MCCAALLLLDVVGVRIIKEMPVSVASGTQCIMGPQSYMRSVVDRNVVMQRITLVVLNKRAGSLSVNVQTLCFVLGLTVLNSTLK